jgi:hypothetical protein
MSDAQRALIARLGAHALHSKYDSRRITAPARAAFLSRFERQVLEDARQRGEELPDAELARRAQHARKAYFTRLALASAKARRERKSRE